MPYNPNEPRDQHGRWTNEDPFSRAARILYPSMFPKPPAPPPVIRRATTLLTNRDISPQKGQEIVGEAKGWRHTPYAPKGTPLAGKNAENQKGGDCSGTVTKIYREAGLPYPYTPSGEFPGAAALGKIPFQEVPPDQRQPGDIVVYDGHNHMAIYSGNDQVESAHRDGIVFGPARVGDFQGTPHYFRYQK